MITISLAGTEADFDDARALCRGFRTFFTERLADHLDVLSKYYPPDQYEQLLTDLPKIHARPEGAILIGRRDGVPMGCTMLRPLGGDAVEMKRMFVSPEARGTGLGRKLVRAAIAQAAADGYKVLRLDTSRLQVEALALYASEGFIRRGPYYEAPEEALSLLVFMERAL